MGRTPFLERTGSLRVLGAAFIAMVLFFVWLTYAVFNKTFVDSVPVTLTASTAGSQLPTNADVKLRGMIVGEVRQITTDGNGVKMEIAMIPSAMDKIPRGVTAQIVPKTLFGEKYIALIPPKVAGGETLQADDNISKADVPIEVETLLNDLYPLLEAVQPAELNYTLTAVSTALEGRGEKFGASLVTLNNYLEKINPDIPQLVDDLIKFGSVANGYADAMPELGRLLKNTVVTGNTIVAKRAQLQAFFVEGTKLSDTLTTFVKANGDNLITLPHETRPVVQILSDYSGTFPCVLEGVSTMIPRLNDTFRDKMLHINLEIIPPSGQPTGYALDENAVVPKKSVIDAQPAANPGCHTLPNPPFTQDNPAPIPPFEVYKLLGIKTDHNKFNRAAIGNDALIDLVQPSADGVDTSAQRADLKTLLGASLGLAQSDVPDVASLLVGPMFRGSAVKISEAR